MNDIKESFPYDGIIFDLDGTLINSLEDLIDACNLMLAHYQLDPYDYETGKTLIGRGLRNLCKQALPEEMGADEAILDEAEALMKAEYAKRYTNKTHPYDGIMDVLAFLKDNNIPFGVCTNKPHEAARVIIDALFDMEDFVDVIGQRADYPRKPDPTQTLQLAQAMGVAPERCIYCGDSLVDYNTARNAGMLPLLCTWGFCPRADLLACDDAICIDRSTQILDIIKGK